MASTNRFLWAGTPAPFSVAILIGAATLWNFFLFPNIGGLSLTLAFVTAFGVVLWATRHDINHRQVAVVCLMIAVGMIPLLIQASTLAWAIAVVALLGVICQRTRAQWRVARLIGAIVCLLPVDVNRAWNTVPEMDGSIAKRFARNWGLAIVGGVGFGVLFVMANPVLASWGDALARLENPMDIGRIWLFAGSAMVLWPLTQLVRMPVAGGASIGFDIRFPAVTLRNALILFNLLFLLQTLTDFAILSGGAALPQGMSMGEYVHRGAYPLLITALLAGGFALIVRKNPEPNDTLKLLLVLWIAQNILLVAASMLRLEAYVSAYGLTHLRIWAAAWMIVVALGLGLLMVNTARELPLGQFIKQASILGAVALYGMSLVNLPATIARHNVGMLQAGERFHVYYNCNLGPMAAHVLQSVDQCGAVVGPRLDNWREWDFRSNRIAHSLQINMEAAR